MKTLLCSALLLLTISSAHAAAKPGYSDCRTDGCDMNRTSQVEAVLKYIDGSDCNSLNSSLLKLERLTDDRFLITCGDGPADQSKTLVKVVGDFSDGPMKVIVLRSK